MHAVSDLAPPPRDEPAYREMSFEFRDFGRGGLSASTLETHLDL